MSGAADYYKEPRAMADKRQRNKDIYQAYCDGASIPDISEIFRLHRTQIRQIISSQLFRAKNPEWIEYDKFKDTLGISDRVGNVLFRQGIYTIEKLEALLATGEPIRGIGLDGYRELASVIANLRMRASEPEH
jgi:hypothetical protein